MPALRTRDTHSRPLEVATDVSAFTALSIVSPTPRSYTFPATHNLDAPDSPSSTPSPVSFEHQRHLSNASPFITSPTSIISGPFSIHGRKRSGSNAVAATEADAERRPKKGDADYIKRPENAFILFRRKCCEERQAAIDEAASEGAAAKKQRQADLSKAISQQWKSLSVDERLYWETLAKEKKKEHEQMYPHYVYRPQRTREKEARSKSRKPTSKARRATANTVTSPTTEEEEEDLDTLGFIIPMPSKKSRSSSLPGHSDYQQVQLPNLYSNCDDSASLLPMLSKRAGHPNYPAADDGFAAFDYMPSLSVPQEGYVMNFDRQAQSTDYLRNIFNADPNSYPSFSTPTSTFSSSGASSPTDSPCTPSSGMLSQHFTMNPMLDPQGFIVPHSNMNHSIGLDYHHQAQYPHYSWDHHPVWSGGEASVLANDEFSLSSIPPIVLEGQQEVSVMSQPLALIGSKSHQQHNESQGLGLMMQPPMDELDNINFGFALEHSTLAFDELMSSHNF